uniref:Uncharacterized protein n=1 Tax=Nelumbo nucifera TaxID=4432 RepID=A0A822XWX6_NELNU|nr:TPA_asm: hypothetical protein HUJ06_024979 [Nelumbo nucifera]
MRSTSMRNKEGASNNLESLDQTKGTNEPPREIINIIGVETSKQCISPSPVLGNNDHGKVVLCQPAKYFDARSSTCTSGPFPLQELSLEHVKHQDEGVFQEKHVLNHSDASLFSR